jgi:hypothetical protein
MYSIRSELLLSVVFVSLLGCDTPPGAAAPDSAPVEASTSLSPWDWQDTDIDERACGLILGRSTREDVVAIFGAPAGLGSQSDGTSTLLYIHRDPFSRVPDMVYFMFRREGFDRDGRLVGAIRTSSSGLGEFSCFRDTWGMPPTPICNWPG